MLYLAMAAGLAALWAGQAVSPVWYGDPLPSAP